MMPGHSDDELLRQLRRARETDPQDLHRQAAIEAQLLARYDAWLRPIAESKVGIEATGDIVNRTLESIAKRLQGDLEFPKELWRIALDSLEGDIKDHWRVWYRRRRREPVSLDHETDIPDRRSAAGESPANSRNPSSWMSASELPVRSSRNVTASAGRGRSRPYLTFRSLSQISYKVRERDSDAGRPPD